MIGLVYIDFMTLLMKPANTAQGGGDQECEVEQILHHKTMTLYDTKEVHTNHLTPAKCPNKVKSVNHHIPIQISPDTIATL